MKAESEEDNSEEEHLHDSHFYSSTICLKNIMKF